MTWGKSLEERAAVHERPLDNNDPSPQWDGRSNRGAQRDGGHHCRLGKKLERFVFWGHNGILEMICDLANHGGIIVWEVTHGFM